MKSLVLPSPSPLSFLSSLSLPAATLISPPLFLPSDVLTDGKRGREAPK